MAIRLPCACCYGWPNWCRNRRKLLLTQSLARNGRCGRYASRGGEDLRGHHYELRDWRATRKATVYFSAPTRVRQLLGKTVRHVFPSLKICDRVLAR